MPVTVTVGTNSYISVADADTYFEFRLDADSWTSAGSDTKAKALITATKRIDMQVIRGQKASTTQDLQFPRCYWDPNRRVVQADTSNVSTPLQDGWYCESEVDQRVIDACCEEGLALLDLTSWEKKRERQHQLGIVGQSIGDANEYAQQAVVKAKAMGSRSLYSPDARRLLSGFLAGAVGIQ